jgi:hypothetical protein
MWNVSGLVYITLALDVVTVPLLFTASALWNAFIVVLILFLLPDALPVPETIDSVDNFEKGAVTNRSNRDSTKIRRSLSSHEEAPSCEYNLCGGGGGEEAESESAAGSRGPVTTLSPLIANSGAPSFSPLNQQSEPQPPTLRSSNVEFQNSEVQGAPLSSVRQKSSTQQLAGKQDQQSSPEKPTSDNGLPDNLEQDKAGTIHYHLGFRNLSTLVSDFSRASRWLSAFVAKTSAGHLIDPTTHSTKKTRQGGCGKQQQPCGEEGGDKDGGSREQGRRKRSSGDQFLDIYVDDENGLTLDNGRPSNKDEDERSEWGTILRDQRLWWWVAVFSSCALYAEVISVETKSRQVRGLLQVIDIQLFFLQPPTFCFYLFMLLPSNVSFAPPGSCWLFGCYGRGSWNRRKG